MASDLFYLIDFIISIILCLYSWLVSFLTILIILKRRELRTFNNILLCNSCLAIIFNSILTLLTSILGLNEYWAMNTLNCSIRAYFYGTSLTSIYYSKLVHSISHYFFSILYKYRYLLTWRIHILIILIGWLVNFLFSLIPFVVENGYSYEKESRSCVISSQRSYISLAFLLMGCFLPFHCICYIDMKIIINVRRSSRRIHPILTNSQLNKQNSLKVFQQNKREMKVAKQMLFESFTFLSGGPIYLFLTLWHCIQVKTAPDILYSFSFNLAALSVSIVVSLQLIMNKKIKRIIFNYFYQH